jgi:DNA integrity scanning protein DisA with diadenylate cyclase activity
MPLSAIDTKIINYLLQLGVNEKKSILEVIKSLVKAKEEEISVSIEDYNQEIQEAMQAMDAGESYSNEEAKLIASTW